MTENKKTYKFSVECFDDVGAGLRGFTDVVSITVESGDPGGDLDGPDSFQAFMRTALCEWYDEGFVAILKEEK